MKTFKKITGEDFTANLLTDIDCQQFQDRDLDCMRYVQIFTYDDLYTLECNIPAEVKHDPDWDAPLDVMLFCKKYNNVVIRLLCNKKEQYFYL